MGKLKLIILIILVVIGIFVLVQIINAAKYEMVVNVVEGENVVGLNPTTERLDFGDLSRNNRIVRRVAVENRGGINSYVMAFKWGELAELVDIDKNFFTLEPGQEEQLNFEVTIPPSAETRIYKGKVWVLRVPKPI